MHPIDYLINTFMIPFLKFSYGIYPNYGLAIILLTVLVKIIFLPLTQKQFSSMTATQRLQPEIKKLQEKYKKEPEKLSKEMMRVWKENKVNPLGGCLPALIQLPFFIAIFYTIKSQGFVDLMSQPGVNMGLFPFWISNLREPDHLFVLPVFIAAITFLSQKMMVTDPRQSSMLMMMPAIMFVMCLRMPGGVLLYWAASQGLSSLHQFVVVRRAKIA